MAIYATKQNYIDKFTEAELIELTDRTNLGAVNDTVLEVALVQADSDIDKYLRQKGWSLPLSVQSDDLMQIALDIARYYLFTDQMIDIVEKNFNRRMKELSDYVKGLLIFDIGVPPATVGDIDYIAQDRIFTHSTLEGF